MARPSLWHRIRSVMFSSLETGIAELSDASGLQQIGLQLNSAPRILIMTSELGHGHSRAAQALRLALLQQCPDAQVTIYDWWSLLNEDVAAAIKQMYLRVVQRHPQLYEALYQLDERTWRNILSKPASLPPVCLLLLKLIETLYREIAATLPAHGKYATDRALFGFICTGGSDHPDSVAGGLRAKLALLKWHWSRVEHRLGNHIEMLAPDAIICTQMIPGALVSAVKKQRKLGIPSIAVPTDFGVHEFWRQPGTDLYCVGHESLLAPRWLQDRRRTHAGQVSATGFALMPQFTGTQSEYKARIELSLDPSRPVILILGGGLGLGVEGVTRAVLAAELNAQLLVLCGHNSPAHAALVTLSERFPTVIQILDWTDNVATYMRAADIVVGKPGGLSVAETLCCGRPFLATRSLGGQEGFNARFIQNFGVGHLLTDEGLIKRLRYLLKHPEEIQALKSRAANLLRRDGARRIATQVLAMSSNHAIRTKELLSCRYGHDS